MENENREMQEQELPEEELLEEQTPSVDERPTWHRVIAWVGVILFAAVVAMFYIHMFRGGK